MEVHGSASRLKGAMLEEYKSKVSELNRQKSAQIKEIEKGAGRDRALLEQELKQELESKRKEARAMVLNEQKLAAKRRFEEARESMVLEVMQAARRKFPAVMKSKQYLSFDHAL